MAVPTISENSTAPRSSHVADPTLQSFLQPTFDPADYLNATLPALSLSSVSSRPLKQGTAVPLADLSVQTNDLLSQLNAHTTRLSTILTQLTDDILRSGGRLAYEVEVLRGETLGLTDTLTESLSPAIKKFVPEGISLSSPQSPPSTSNGNVPTSPPEPFPTFDPTDASTSASASINPNPTTDNPTAPELGPADHITPLRTLTLVRTRLDAVIQIFGEAMHWTLPPSDTSTSLTSSLISVSSPSPSAPGTSTDLSTLESRGQAFATSLRAEIAELVAGSASADADADAHDKDKVDGFAAAQSRISALRDLASVWKGTAEEKARIKFVDGLVRLAEEKQRERENAWSQSQSQRQQGRPARSGSVRRDRERDRERQKEGGREQREVRTGGFLENLQRIRGNMSFE
ncbi:hypothetical protein K491DRAFT_684450 [Lophiostoma macrostomum CBS 122681]|uniref:Uncharacterized protein n=1 Tax=Lophiostoma macrostomum CBS 122681 TaxID=1314788 RepID=A0A6A6SP19_9PLEO|nr:hypothetical protein K491DRAFT_684450 [Lophiostoma macrostomum CBS 122681]